LTTLIDGRSLALKTKENLKERIEEIKKKGVTPGLVVILVGNNPASEVYVRGKVEDAESLGFYSIIERLVETISQEELIDIVEQYNNDERVHGILVQLPLPKHIDERAVTVIINPKKDVDGFHPLNMGELLLGNPMMIPCTPFGVMRMFEEYNIDLTGKEAVVVGRSNIVGKPMAILMTKANATVTVTHSRTRNLSEITSRADILVAAIGVARMITQKYVKENAVVIDVGMNRLSSGKLQGDVDFADVEEKTSFITPAPGGVGPMTRAMLMEQTVTAAENHVSKTFGKVF